MAVELWLVWERFGAVRPVMDWQGSQGFAGHVTVERGEAGQSTVGQGSRGLARRGEVQYVAANLGMAGHVKAVMSRFGFACCGVAVEASRCALRSVMVWLGLDGLGSRGKSRCGKAWIGAASQSRRGDVVLGTVRFCVAAQSMTS